MKWIYILLSLAAGVASATQGLFNGYWQERIDMKAVLLVNAVVVFAAALLYYLWGLKYEEETLWSAAGASILVGGVCGVIIVVAFALAFPKIGAFEAVILFIVGQVFAAVAFDAFGVMNLPAVAFGWEKLVGALLVAVGAFMVLSQPTSS